VGYGSDFVGCWWLIQTYPDQFVHDGLWKTKSVGLDDMIQRKKKRCLDLESGENVETVGENVDCLAKHMEASR
jgi:hypothetical protein